MSKNLQFTRRRLKLSQKQFVENFISDEDGKPLLSVSKLSNLENKGGNNLERVCGRVADRLDLTLDNFQAEPADFSEKLEERLTNSDLCVDKNLDNIVHEADRHSQLVAFIHVVSNYLTDLLLNDKLLPGDKIPSERALSKQFHVSRSIARESLKVLNVLGMIDIIPGKGTFIANSSSDFFVTPLSWAIYLTDKNAYDVFDVRRSIEETMLPVAVQNANEENIEDLRSILEKSKAAMEREDYRSYSEMDLEFHMHIVQISGNSVAVSLLSVLRKLSTAITQKSMTRPEQLMEIYSEHSRLVDAIGAGNTEDARAALISHFDKTRGRYQESEVR